MLSIFRCSPSLVNYFIKCVYEKTSMFSQQAVIGLSLDLGSSLLFLTAPYLDTLNRIEEWLIAFDKSKMTLPK